MAARPSLAPRARVEKQRVVRVVCCLICCLHVIEDGEGMRLLIRKHLGLVQPQGTGRGHRAGAARECVAFVAAWTAAPNS